MNRMVTERPLTDDDLADTLMQIENHLAAAAKPLDALAYGYGWADDAYAAVEEAREKVAQARREVEAGHHG